MIFLLSQGVVDLWPAADSPAMVHGPLGHGSPTCKIVLQRGPPAEMQLTVPPVGLKHGPATSKLVVAKKVQAEAIAMQVIRYFMIHVSSFLWERILLSEILRTV